MSGINNKCRYRDLYKPNSFIYYTKLYRINPSRMQTLKFIINAKEINLINVYGPNNDDGNFFEQLETYLKENDEKIFIIGGDFNTVPNEKLEKRNGRIGTV